MISTLYRGSVKNLLGPVSSGGIPALVFEYSDAYSVFDWGRMPDLLPGKGHALAVMAADLFEKLGNGSTWTEFSKTPEALALRKANRFGSAFNEIGEVLKVSGLKTHYLGVPAGVTGDAEIKAIPLSDFGKPTPTLLVKQVSSVKPEFCSILGRMVPDYLATRSSPPPRLIPLEVVFRFSLPPGSSLLDRVAKHPDYLATIGYGDLPIQPGVKWDFPVLELFTKLETTDRVVPLPEALAISGVSAAQLQEVLLKTAWVGGYLKAICQRRGLELADGKLEWAIDADGSILLVDAIGPDELRILKDGVQLSKEFLRTFYRHTPWYQALEQAKQQAKKQGVAEWKKLLSAGPPHLPENYMAVAAQLYKVLTHEITGRRWFSDAWSLDQVVSELKKL